MEAVRLWFTGFWRSTPMTVVMVGAIAIHVCLAMWKLILGKTWRMPWWQWAQIGLGFAIPLFLAEHLLSTRIIHEVFGMDNKYAIVLLAIWPSKQWGMIYLIAAVWLHRRALLGTALSALFPTTFMAGQRRAVAASPSLFGLYLGRPGSGTSFRQ
jgi:hypothetical protein